MVKLNILQDDYTAYTSCYQIKLPLNLEVKIPSDDPVRLLSAFVEGMDLSELYKTYDRVRKNQASPRQMLKIVLYASMNRIYSSRDIESACRRDINFMYLLEGKSAPDHATIARFISLHLSECSKDLLTQMDKLLYDLGEISGKTVFIDGTKIESCANKYTFVWKRAVTRNMEKLSAKITDFVAECEEMYGLKVVYNDQVSMHTLKRLRKKLYALKEEEGIDFVHGVGHRKSILQKSIETLDDYISRLKGYTKDLHILGKRNSYSKTDPDATFMRMKEDVMGNGQLKPAYNLQHGVDSEYITWLDISEHPTDYQTLIPFLKDMEDHLPFRYQEVVADAGYESEENYIFLEEHDQVGYIKPKNYEISKTRTYKQDMGRHENMKYDEEKDLYICQNGKELTPQYKKDKKTESGYVKTSTIYMCKDCRDCPYKRDCIKGNNCHTPWEERNKTFEISKVLEQKRKEDLDRITSDYGTQLRLNRGIQAEGSFAEIKEDMDFRRYLYRGKKNVLAQSVLIAMGRNINKLHHRIQSGRTGTHLYELENTA